MPLNLFLAINEIAPATAGNEIGAQNKSPKAETRRPPPRDCIQPRTSGHSGLRTFVRRTTAADWPGPVSAASTSAFCRPYSVFGQTASSGLHSGRLPSKTRLDEIKTKK